MKDCSPEFDFNRETFRFIPIWIKIFGILSAYWTGYNISEISSTIGTPLKTDWVTGMARYAKFVRVCIAKEVGSEFSDSLDIITSCGQ